LHSSNLFKLGGLVLPQPLPFVDRANNSGSGSQLIPGMFQVTRTQPGLSNQIKLHLTVKLFSEYISLKFKGGEQQALFVCTWTYVLEFGQVTLRNSQSFCNLKREKKAATKVLRQECHHP